MSNILVGAFEELDGATRARAALLQAGFSEDHVSVRSRDSVEDPTRSHPAIFDNRTDEMPDDTGGIGGWLRSLFGQDDQSDDRDAYRKAIEEGVYLVTVSRVPDKLVDEASGILEQHGAIDIDERLQRGRAEGAAPVAGHDTVLPGVAGRPPAAGRQGVRTDVDQDFGRRERPEDDDRYRLDEQGYPPLENADPADVAALVARNERAKAWRAKVRVYYRVEPDDEERPDPGRVT
jgi:hypothetical protein